MPAVTDTPPEPVLLAFGAAAPPVRLPGGRGTSWRAGELVLKPAPSGALPTIEWLDRVAPSVSARARLRLAVPVRAADGALVVDGWSATRWLPGAAPVGAWLDRAAVARELAGAFASVDPLELPRRDDAWATADRIAWDEEDGPLGDHPLARVRTPLAAAEETVVHGDLAGNTLLHPELPPAVIDLSLYARPVEWSVAVLAVDVVAFDGAPIELLRTISPDPSFPQHLVRALLFRMITDELLGDAPRPAYLPVVEQVLALAR
ncbi:TIGR02569 family protein [Amnibacterium sp.]|uniref:TIGR02569 family protein n=1 Tax=Amnibacterium sp. TaxID=1872496 RepID=UPI00262545F7|nr:TIGR02569 family protein [Amnibacterium sp.]MCU1472984.1 aminoglycoside phosphotransferase [Amnibacterium sp.]